MDKKGQETTDICTTVPCNLKQECLYCVAHIDKPTPKLLQQLSMMWCPEPKVELDSANNILKRKNAHSPPPGKGRDHVSSPTFSSLLYATLSEIVSELRTSYPVNTLSGFTCTSDLIQFFPGLERRLRLETKLIIDQIPFVLLRYFVNTHTRTEERQPSRAFGF